MSNFWPDGFSLNDVQSPDDILGIASEDWENRSSGILMLVLQKTESQDGDTLIIVHAKHIPSNRTVTLLTVRHRQDNPYPVTIEPMKDDIPHYLKKSYYAAGPADYEDEYSGEGGTITNNWVSDTPAEFRIKLIDAFNLSVIKTTIFNLTSAFTSEKSDNDQETT